MKKFVLEIASRSCPVFHSKYTLSWIELPVIYRTEHKHQYLELHIVTCIESKREQEYKSKKKNMKWEVHKEKIRLESEDWKRKISKRLNSSFHIILKYVIICVYLNISVYTYNHQFYRLIIWYWRYPNNDLDISDFTSMILNLFRSEVDYTFLIVS